MFSGGQGNGQVQVVVARVHGCPLMPEVRVFSRGRHYFSPPLGETAPRSALRRRGVSRQRGVSVVHTGAYFFFHGCLDCRVEGKEILAKHVVVTGARVLLFSRSSLRCGSMPAACMQ